jgi:hypothetical protein
MRVSAAGLVADAWALFRRDRDLLLALAGPFWFLPSFALTLLVPPPPALPAGVEPGGAAWNSWSQNFAQWLSAQGSWYLLGAAIGAWGTASVFALYLDRRHLSLGDALARGAAIWPRYMLLSALTGIMTFAGLLLWVVPGLYILGRVLLAGPALVAERPLGALAAVGRGFALSRGAGLTLMALATLTLVGGWLLPQPLLGLDEWLRARAGGPNPVALATVDALAAAIAAAAALATALIAVAAYRRAASSGT